MAASRESEFERSYHGLFEAVHERIFKKIRIIHLRCVFICGRSLERLSFRARQRERVRTVSQFLSAQCLKKNLGTKIKESAHC